MLLEQIKRISIRGVNRELHTSEQQEGARRIASSAVWKGADLLFEYGIKHLELHVVVCGKRTAWRLGRN